MSFLKNIKSKLSLKSTKRKVEKLKAKMNESWNALLDTASDYVNLENLGLKKFQKPKKKTRPPVKTKKVEKKVNPLPKTMKAEVKPIKKSVSKSIPKKETFKKVQLSAPKQEGRNMKHNYRRELHSFRHSNIKEGIENEIDDNFEIETPAMSKKRGRPKRDEEQEEEPKVGSVPVKSAPKTVKKPIKVAKNTKLQKKSKVK